jgi:YidC/Oxa1 family membrane protein insertase
MKKNYIVAFVLSFAILMLWEKLVLQPRRKTAPVPEPAPAASSVRPGAANAVREERTPSPSVKRESALEFEIGNNRLSVNRYGGGIQQWEIREGGRWLALMPKKDFSRQPLAAFPDLLFDVRREGDAIRMSATAEDGLRVEKTLDVNPAGPLHQLKVRVTNLSKTTMNVAYSIGWGPGVEAADEGSKDAKGFQRAIAYEPPRLDKLKPSTPTGAYAWWGVDGHYFLAAFISPETAPPSVSLIVEKEDRYFSVRRKVEVPLSPEASQEEAFTFYLGSKAYEGLKAAGFGLEKSVDFGFFASLGRLIHRSLFLFHKTTGNYGWAIILMTFIIQVLVLPLTVKSFQHGQRMKTIQPQLKRIQELYKGDPRRLNSEMMEMYKRHGLRFMGMEGCVPILIQLPVFWALFSALRNTYELRHAPWIGWVRDLSAHDPFYVLPVLMGAGMFFQQKMSMSSMDPTQRQIMYIMPIMFTFIFLKMPSGLVLYWLTNSLLTIGIQAFLLKRHAAEPPK